MSDERVRKLIDALEDSSASFASEWLAARKAAGHTRPQTPAEMLSELADMRRDIERGRDWRRAYDRDSPDPR